MSHGTPLWHGSDAALRANAEDSGKPGHQPVDTSTDRHEKGLEAFARNAVRWTRGTRAARLRAGERAHNAAEKTIKP